MYRQFTLLTLFALFLIGSVAGLQAAESEQAPPKQKQEQKKQPAKDSAASLTGCVDEQNGKYVMIDERTRDPLADLAAEGFETEGFAKHVGHKVTVRGISSSGDARPLFKVRSIETISDTCEPHSLSRGN